MKRLISLIVVLISVFALVGCSGMTAGQRNDRYDLKGCGNAPFVTEPHLCYYQKFGY
jgi:hypothetical protein